MSGTTIAWDSTTPTATDLVGQGDDVIRSLKSNMQGALDAEHLWPSAGGYSGLHRKGSARVFVGTSSQVSSADTDGRLMFNSTLSHLVYLDSARSVIVGGVSAIHGPASGVLSVVTQRLVMEAGTYSQLVSGTTWGQTFATAFVAPPIVTVTLIDVESTSPMKGRFAVQISTVATSGFSFHWMGVDGGSASTASMTFIAVGKVNNP